VQWVPDVLRATDLPQGSVVTIGNFDGLHRGQKKLVDLTVLRARELRSNSALLTFEPHPLAVLDPSRLPPRLLTPKQRSELLEAWGLDALLVLRFDAELASWSPERFVREVLSMRLQAHEVVVGSAFRFGKDRAGNVSLLEELGRQFGFRVHAVPEEQDRFGKISATRIRELLLAGKVEEAREMLGRPYGIVGRVVRGDRMGQRLGWPTVNLELESELVPANGVYATRIRLSSFEGWFVSVTNIGTRPTVYENHQRVVESHILDFAAEVYGDRVELEFHRRLRDEKLFPSIPALAQQIRRDVEAAREYFARLSGVLSKSAEWQRA
jgi:riboflavin kinase/FMN adenylyltransferase